MPGETIVNGNDSFGSLVGLAASDLGGVPLARFLPGAEARLALAGQPEQPIEAELRGPEGEPIPVELIVRPVTYGQTPHYAVAVRDLRARRKAEGRSTSSPTTTPSPVSPTVRASPCGWNGK